MFRALARYDPTLLLELALPHRSNTAIDYLRSAGCIATPVEIQTTSPIRCRRRRTLRDQPERSAERSELAAAVDRALDRVRPDYRAVLVLRYQEGLEYQDIADVLGAPLGTVKTFLHRARRDLARELSAAGWGLKPGPSAGRKAE